MIREYIQDLHHDLTQCQFLESFKNLNSEFTFS